MSKVILRALTLRDAETSWQWRNKEEIISLYSGHPFPVSYELEKAWYEKVMYSNFPTTVFAIDIVGDNGAEFIGITTLMNINMLNRTSDFSILIGDEKYRGKGYSKQATIDTLLFGFNQIGLNKISLKVREENIVAYNLYKKIGFVQEGVLKESVFKNSVFHNEILMAVFKNDFVK
jgi:diamine N-acetyltransferase